jgi:hypothetical protein
MGAASAAAANMRPPDGGFLKVPADGPDFRTTMLTVTDQQLTSDRPTLCQSDLRLELMPADNSPALPLSLLLGVPSTHAVGGETPQS